MDIIKFKARYGVRGMGLLVKRLLEEIPDSAITPKALELTSELGRMLANLEYSLDQVEPRTNVCHEELMDRFVKEWDEEKNGEKKA